MPDDAGPVLSRDGVWHSQITVGGGFQAQKTGFRASVRAFLGDLWQRVATRAITSLPWGSSGGLGTSEMHVNKALRLAPVWAAGRLLASNVAQLPVQVYQKTGEQRVRMQNPVLFDAPSTQGTLYDWLFRAMTSLVYRGNAVGYITTRDGYGTPTTIEWLNPDDVSVDDSMPAGRGSFTDPIWYLRGRVVPADSLLHIPWMVVPGKIWGLSPIGAMRSAVEIGLQAQDYSRDWFRAGGMPPGTFRNTQAVVKQDDAVKMKARLVESIRTHEPIVFGRDWEYTPISVNPGDATFIDTMKLTAGQIADIYGIPPEMIGGQTTSSLTYQNVEQQAINFLQFTLMPWITKLESHLSRLLPDGQYVKFNVDSLIRTDTLTRYETYEIARKIGLKSINELRVLEDDPPIAGGDDYTPLPTKQQASPPVSSPMQRHLEVVDGEIVTPELERPVRLDRRKADG